MIERDWPRVAYLGYPVYAVTFYVSRYLRLAIVMPVEKLAKRIEHVGINADFAMRKRFSASCRAAIAAKERAQS